MTALSSTEDKVKGFEVGAVDYVTKPIQPEEVLARIKLHLQLRHMNNAQNRQNEILTAEIEQRKVVQARLGQINHKLEQEVSDRITAQEALKKLNEELEHGVEKRTIQLRQSNRQLQQEILERKQAEGIVRNSLKEKEILLEIKDDGIGVSPDFDFLNSDSLGLKLVSILTRQLEGEIQLIRDEGTCFQIIFSELDYSDRL